MEEMKKAIAIPQGKRIVLNLATGGLFDVIHLYANREKFNKLVGREAISNQLLMTGIAIHASLFWTFGLVLFSSRKTIGMISMIGGGTMLASVVIQVIIALAVAKAIEEYAKKKGFAFKINPALVVMQHMNYVNKVLLKPSTAANNEGSNTTTDSSIEQLEKLAEMKDKGILTEDEFLTKKKELLEA